MLFVFVCFLKREGNGVWLGKWGGGENVGGVGEGKDWLEYIVWKKSLVWPSLHLLHYCFSTGFIVYLIHIYWLLIKW